MFLIDSVAERLEPISGNVLILDEGNISQMPCVVWKSNLICYALKLHPTSSRLTFG